MQGNALPTGVRLPYVPSPYPGEILGSWLARIELHSGKGAWKALRESVGLPRRNGQTMFDMARYSPELDQLFKSLGMDYEQAMLGLTTLPYWLSFEAAEAGTQRMAGFNRAPPPIPGGRMPLSIAHIGLSRTIGLSVRARFCPKCLDEDVSSFGEPYWHREHQIPNVFFCHRHRCALRTTCPGCGHVIATGSGELLDLPSLRCACGTDLRRAGRATGAANPFLELANVSASAVSSALPSWSRGHVRALLWQLAGAEPGDQHLPSYKEILITKFGEVQRTWSEFMFAPVPGAAKEPGVQLRLNGFPGGAKAPELCALLVALDLSWGAAVMGFSQAEPLPQPEPRAPRVRGLTIEKARRQVLEWGGDEPWFALSTCRRAYWYLRINDPAWLKQNLSSKRLRPLPSVEADREVITKLMSTWNRRRPLDAVSIRTSVIGVRATFRDKDWLEAQLQALRRQAASRTGGREPLMIERRIRMLENALERIVRNEARPRYIFTRTLAKAAGITSTQVHYAIVHSPQLRAKIESANKDRLRRAFVWAANKLIEEGQTVHMRSLSARAGEPRSKQNNPIMRAVIASLADKKASAGVEA